MLHDCDRFKAVGLRCPFRRFEEEEDESQEEEKGSFPKFMVPARKEREVADNISRLPLVVHGQPQMKKALERLAAIQSGGGLSSIPQIGVPNFPLQGRGHPEIISALAAIALMKFFGAVRSKGFGMSGRVVQAGERRVAQGLSKVIGKVSGAGRTRGRGGFHVDAAADLKRLLGVPSLGGVIPPGGGPK